MTKEEYLNQASSYKTSRGKELHADALINEIFDDFELRICENCKHGVAYDGNVYQCRPLYDALGGIETFTAHNFGCNKWSIR